MHACEEFREKITEQMLDRVDLDRDAETQRQLLVCSACAEFYAESREMLDALSTVQFEIADSDWEAMADRMSIRIHQDYAARQQVWRRWFYIPAFAGALAMLLL